MTVTAPADITLLPDAGPLITLAYADALDLLIPSAAAIERQAILAERTFSRLRWPP